MRQGVFVARPCDLFREPGVSPDDTALIDARRFVAAAAMPSFISDTSFRCTRRRVAEREKSRTRASIQLARRFESPASSLQRYSEREELPPISCHAEWTSGVRLAFAFKSSWSFSKLVLLY